jgi:hypothetical protein
LRRKRASLPDRYPARAPVTCSSSKPALTLADAATVRIGNVWHAILPSTPDLQFVRCVGIASGALTATGTPVVSTVTAHAYVRDILFPIARLLAGATLTLTGLLKTPSVEPFGADTW